MDIDFKPLLISLNLSFWTTGLLLILAFPVALFLGFNKSWFKSLLEPLISLPLVLPPTVIGFYILLLLSPRYPLGAFFERYLNVRLVFSFPGMLIASVIYCFPFMVQPLKNGLESINKHLIEVAYTLGKSRFETFIRVILPGMKNFILTGIAMTFAHTMGEFGVILMVGGNIPDTTRVVSIYIFENVEMLNYKAAHTYALIMLGLAFVVLFLVSRINARTEREKQ